MNKQPNNTIQQVFELIRSDEKSRNNILRDLYNDDKLRSMVYNFIQQKGGSKEDARSVFNFSLAKFVKSVLSKKDLKINSSINQYIYGIARFTWYDEINQKPEYKEFDESYMTEIVKTPNRLELEEQKILLKGLMDQLMKNCKEVLMYWANDFSMKEIAEKLGYKSFKMAKKKKYECLKQLTSYLNDHPELKEKLK